MAVHDIVQRLACYREVARGFGDGEAERLNAVVADMFARMRETI